MKVWKMKRHTGTGRDIQEQTGTYKDRQGQAGTNEDRQRPDILNVQNFTQPDFGWKKIYAKKSVIF